MFVEGISPFRPLVWHRNLKTMTSVQGPDRQQAREVLISGLALSSESQNTYVHARAHTHTHTHTRACTHIHMQSFFISLSISYKHIPYHVHKQRHAKAMLQRHKFKQTPLGQRGVAVNDMGNSLPSLSLGSDFTVEGIGLGDYHTCGVFRKNADGERAISSQDERQ